MELTARKQMVTRQDGQDADAELTATAQQLQPRGSSSSASTGVSDSNEHGMVTWAFFPGPKLITQGTRGFLRPGANHHRFLRIGQSEFKHFLQESAHLL